MHYESILYVLPTLCKVFLMTIVIKSKNLIRFNNFCSNLSYFKYIILVCSKPNCCAYSDLKNQLAD